MSSKTGDKILVVDDTPKNLTLLTAILERRQYEVITAADGDAALKATYEHMPDLVLLDIMMPRVDGFEVCKRLKADDRSADIPVIFISALDDTQDIIRAFDVGGVDYVTKPFKSREVLRRVESHLTLLKQRRELEKVREEEREQFERINTMREQFIRSATHDLKNPLSLITGYTSLMELIPEINESEKVQEYIQLIRHGSNKMRALVQDMLDLIQLQASDTGFNPQVTKLNEIVEQVLMDFEVECHGKKLTLTKSIPESNIHILIDRHMMRIMIQQLISNAIKFSNEGDTITVKLEANLEKATITIEDTGLGIPAEHLSEVFTPFFRVPATEHQEREGSGLGLAHAQTIATKHGGKVEAKSKVGEGSTFTVTLPL